MLTLQALYAWYGSAFGYNAEAYERTAKEICSHEVLFGHFPSQLFLDVQKTPKTGAAALELELQFIEYLLDFGPFLGVVRCLSALLHISQISS